MKKFTTKLISLALSIVMVATILPMGMFVAEAGTSWSVLASSDFSTVNSVSQDTAFTPSTYAGGNTMTWTPHDYTSSASVDSTNGGISIPDGYMYISGYTTGHSPLDGLSRWKIDLGFRFTTTNSGDDKYYNSDNYCFMKSYVYTGDLEKPSQKNNAYCHFCQNANGVVYSWENDGHNGGTQSQATSITTGNGNLVKDTNYHYIAEYTGTHFRTYITDDSNGKIVQLIADVTDSTLLGRLGNSASVTMRSFALGDDDNSYYFKGLEYQNITFYSGTTIADTSTSAQPSNNNDKYVMAYFTGNYNQENESLRYAVSSDGINFHALNKGLPVTDIDIPESGEGLTVYPEGATMTGAWSTGNVRDPFIVR
jgi:hypothetical protein